MNKRIEFQMELRGKTVYVAGLVHPPEHDVGIMGWWSDGMSVKDENGQELELTDQEIEQVDTAASNYAGEHEGDFFDD